MGKRGAVGRAGAPADSQLWTNANSQALDQLQNVHPDLAGNDVRSF